MFGLEPETKGTNCCVKSRVSVESCGRGRPPQTLTTEHIEAAIALRGKAGNQVMCAAYYICAGWKIITKSITTNVACV